MLLTKAPQIRTNSDDNEHLYYVADLPMAQGWEQPAHIAEPTKAEGAAEWIGAQGNPIFSVIAK